MLAGMKKQGRFMKQPGTTTINVPLSPAADAARAAQKAEKKAAKQAARKAAGQTLVMPALTKTVMPQVTKTATSALRPTVMPAVARTNQARPPVALASPEQVAQQVTKEIRQGLKKIAEEHIRVGVLLARVRDEKLYAALGNKNIVQYAKERLGIESSSLYAHLDAHDWIASNRPEWLEPNSTGFIPDQKDFESLVWIDERLARKDMEPATRAGLEALRAKAFTGKLTQDEVVAFKRSGNKIQDARRAYISKLRLIRMRGAALAGIPPEAIAHLDAAIEIVKTAIAQAKTK